jgi:hypothetical protein
MTHKIKNVDVVKLEQRVTELEEKVQKLEGVKCQ